MYVIIEFNSITGKYRAHRGSGTGNILLFKEEAPAREHIHQIENVTEKEIVLLLYKVESVP